MAQETRIYTTSFASVYPHYVAKAERKGRTREEVDEVIRWLTGYDMNELSSLVESETDFETFFAEAPQVNPARRSITGVVCGVRVETIEAPLMQEIRYLDKLIDEAREGQGDGEDPPGSLAVSDRPAVTSIAGLASGPRRPTPAIRAQVVVGGAD